MLLSGLRTNWTGAQALRLFLACGRRMVVGFDGVIGFDLRQVEIVARSRGISLEKVLPSLEVIEDEYLSIVRKKKKEPVRG